MHYATQQTAYFFLVLACSIFIFGMLAAPAHAQSREDWREWWQHNNDGADIDYDEMRGWRERSSRVRDEIDELDDDEVDDLPIPILFGISLDDLTPNFGDPRDGGSREHEGLDMLVAEGTPIVSPTEAVVIRVGSGSSSGKYVSTANPGDETFVYMHLDEVADIDEGDVLAVGDVIGYVGNTGNASGGPAHLHFEIREDRDAKDPYDRLTEEFPLEKKIEFLEGILRDVDDEDEYAEFLVGEYLRIFIQGRTEGIELPEEIVDALPASVARANGSIPERDLTLDSTGADVSVLQSVLIAEGYLDITTPTGYFGPLTEAALATYQEANSIAPASGYYGPITRSYFNNSTDYGTGALTRVELLERIEELRELVEELQEELASR